MNIIETAWNWSGGLSNRSKTDYIVLHHAAAVTCSAADVDRWHKQNGWSGIGYHHFVRKDGDVYRGRPEWSMGAARFGICVDASTYPDADSFEAFVSQQYNSGHALSIYHAIEPSPRASRPYSSGT